MVSKKISLSRRVLLDLAWAMIDDDGLANFSMRGLARKCGCSAPSLYEYFRSLEDILLELRKREERQLFNVLENESASFGNAAEAAAGMTRAYIRYFGDSNGRREIFFDTFKTPRKSVDASLPKGSTYQLLVDVMKRLGVELDCRLDHSEEWAFAVWSYAHGVCVLRANFLEPIADSLEPLIEYGVCVLISGIKANAEAAQ